MHPAVVLALLIIGAAIGATATRLLTRKDPIPVKVRTMLADAAALITQVRYPTSLDHLDVLSARSKTAADRWLTRYNKEFTK